MRMMMMMNINNDGDDDLEEKKGETHYWSTLAKKDNIMLNLNDKNKITMRRECTCKFSLSLFSLLYYNVYVNSSS
jgi:hypothetical protein